MRLLTRLTSSLLLAACATNSARPANPASADTLALLPRISRVILTDARSGAPLGVVQETDSVAALRRFYSQITTGWLEGTAPSVEIGATFYQDTVRVAFLALASGAFEARVAGRVLHRSASPDEALAFARLTGVPVKHGP